MAPPAYSAASLSAAWLVKLSEVIDYVTPDPMDSNVAVFSKITVDSVDLTAAGSCQSWNSFLSSLAVKTVVQEIESVQAVSVTSLQEKVSMLTVSCTANSVASAIVKSMMTNFAAPTEQITTMSCGSAGSWIVGSCSLSPAVAVDGGVSFSPCATDCLGSSTYTDVSYIRALVIRLKAPVPAPAIVNMLLSPGRSAVTVSVRLNSDGQVYCAALDVTPSSVQQVMLLNFVSWTSDNVTSIVITGLSPSSSYTVYCVTVSSQGTLSTLQAVVQQAVQVSTQCCKTITVDLGFKSIYVRASTDIGVTLSVDFLPSDSIEVLLTAVPSQPSQFAQASQSLYFPTTVQFSSTSPSRLIPAAFIGTEIASRFNVTAVLSGTSALEYVVQFSAKGSSFSVIDINQPPVKPQILSAQFSSDGSAMLVIFDSATDRGGSKVGTSIFGCFSILQFRGSDIATCQWSSDAISITAYPAPSNPVQLGDPVALLPGVVRALCSAGWTAQQCHSWDTTSMSAPLILQAPANPVPPSVSIMSPSAIGSCDALILDVSGTTGSGGRKWSNITFRVDSTAPNATTLQGYLNAKYISSPPTAVPHTMLERGYSYMFTVTICNFLGSCGVGSRQVTVLNVIIPFANILGSQVQTVLRKDLVLIRSLAYVASCDGQKSTLNLRYSWSISPSTVGVNQRITSISRDPSTFLLPSFVLQTSITYTVTLSVIQTLSMQSTTTSAQVIVLPSNIIAIILGGSVQPTRLLSAILVDGSNSYDEDQANNGNAGLVYTWSCSQTVPTYSMTCPLEFNSNTAAVFSGYAGAESANTSSVLTLVVSDGVTRHASAAVTINVLSSSAPLVSINTVLPVKVRFSNFIVFSFVLFFLFIFILFFL